MAIDVMSAPYPADTRAKGWRFELDYERISQSSTWALAGPEGRPWLLMLWMTAWQQVPCGSLPADEEVIAALIGCPSKTWAKLRKPLMRGWQAAGDGLLYHETITERVLEMVEQRSKTAKRVADYKAKLREQREGNALPTREQSDKNDTGTGTSNQNRVEKNPPKPPRKRRGAAAQCDLVTVEQMVLEGVDQQVASDWLTVRATKGLPLTPTAWDDTKAEAAKAGMTVGEAVRYSAVRSRGGFRAAWLVSDEAPGVIRSGGAAAPPVNRQEAIEQRNRAVGDEWLRQQEAADAAQ